MEKSLKKILKLSWNQFDSPGLAICVFFFFYGLNQYVEKKIPSTLVRNNFFILYIIFQKQSAFFP